MTESPNADPMLAALDRRLQLESDMPDIREIMRDIPIRRIPPKRHNHSVSHKSYR